jgi:LmbE family N-acetylglucosaminyl deacetylase
MGTLLVIMAHPDDAELMCYGTIKRYEEKGYDCHLLLATMGEKATKSKNLGDSRLDETAEAFKETDINISCLNLPDGFIKQDNTLMTALQKQIEAVNPTVIITHHPDETGLEHQDHSELGRATFSVAIRYDKQLKKLLFAEPLFSYYTYFRPNLYVNIDKYYEEKTKIIKCHASQAEKFYINEKFIAMRACSPAPYINFGGSRFNGKYELFYQAYALEI